MWTIELDVEQENSFDLAGASERTGTNLLMLFDYTLHRSVMKEKIIKKKLYVTDFAGDDGLEPNRVRTQCRARRGNGFSARHCLRFKVSGKSYALHSSVFDL